MKVWVIRYHSDYGEGGKREYFPSKREAEKRHTELLRLEHQSRQDEYEAISLVQKPEKIEVPTDRKSLLRWLNIYAS